VNSSLLRPLALILLVGAVCAGTLCGPLRASTATVALTTSVSAGATEDDKQFAANLLDLMQIEADHHEELDVVERQQLDLALHELANSNAQSNTKKQQLGKLAAADLLLTAKLLPPDEKGTVNLHVRITEPQTAVIRGETLVPTGAKQIEDTAAEVIDYLAIIAKGPNQQTATLAVLPFESVEQFDRLRPLERGLRDLFASYFLEQNHLRVVQRTSMEQLLGELELVRTGLTRDGAGLEQAPEREAFYVLRGEIDERIEPDGNLVILRAELVDARSRKVVATVERETKPKEVASAVTEIAAELAKSIAIGNANGNAPTSAAKTSGKKEVDRLFQLALRDVFRFIRYLPDDAGYIPFQIPGVEQPQNILAEVDPDSPLGVALLEKSIDRLESVLFIEPERLTAALPLAFCLSFHVDGIWRPDECESLLRRIRDESTDPEMKEAAILLLGDMYFPHEGCLYSERDVAQLDPQQAQLAFERRLEACESLANIARGDRIPHTLKMLEKLSKVNRQEERSAALLRGVAKIVAGSKATNTDPDLARAASSVVARTWQSKDTAEPLKKQAENVLRKWNASNDRWTWLFAARQLIILKLGGLSYDQFNARLDELFGDAKNPFEQQTLTEQKTWLAIRLRNENKIADALRILQSFQPKNQSAQLGYDFSYSEYGYQLGRCLEDLGRKQEALAAYMHFAEMPSGYYPSGDFTRHIDQLGGVPLRPDREVDVRYPDLAPGNPYYCRVLTTDGKQLYCAGGFEDDRNGPNAIPIRSIRALDLASSKWTSLGGPDDRVSCLAIGDGKLWAGTDQSGLWRMDIESQRWRQWTTKTGLPTDSVVAVVAVGPTCYASVANINPSGEVVSGGMVRVNDDGVHIYRGPQTPQTAPQSIEFDANRLVTVDRQWRLHVLDLTKDAWTSVPNFWSPIATADKSGLWTAPRGFIATLVDEDFKTLQKFAAAERLPEYHAPSNNYRPKFFLEHDGNLWIGGNAWRRFGDSGLFRLHLATGKLTRFGPRDGFRYDDQNSYTTYAGVWAGGRLWVATSFGLAEVTPRKVAADSPAKPPTATN
jgi:TolB-like protein